MRTLKTYKNRLHLLDVLSEKCVEYACEVGVQKARYSEQILSRIPSLKKLYLIDLWKQQENYKDRANVGNDKQQQFMEESKKRTLKWSNKVEFLRGYSVEMSHKIFDESLDWAYIDARHDYCGCKEDIQAYWPKIKPGGILSGHDYHESREVRGQDWSKCMDGTIHPGAVKGAVDEFAENNGLQVLVSYQEKKWHTWSILKPI